MSEAEQIRAEVHSSVFCVAIGKLTVQVGWASAINELFDRIPKSLHPVVQDVLDNAGNVSPRDMLRAVRIGALRPCNGTIQHKDAVLDQVIGWTFIAVCVALSALIGRHAFDALEFGQVLKDLAFSFALAASALVLVSKAIYPHWVAARVERFLEGKKS